MYFPDRLIKYFFDYSIKMPQQNHGIVGDSVIRNFNFLYQVASCRSAKQRWQLIKNASPDELFSVIEICANLSRGKFRLTKKEERRLCEYSDLVKKLGNTRSLRNAMRHIQHGEGIIEYQSPTGLPRISIKRQMGGAAFLPALLVPVLIELAASAVNDLLS